MSTWIPISERLPTREDAKDAGEVLAVDARGHQWLWEFREYPADMFGLPPVAWMPIPPYTPPTPEPTDTECANLLHYGALVVMNHINPNEDVPLEEQFAMVRRWFADVTARIEREKGK